MECAGPIICSWVRVTLKGLTMNLIPRYGLAVALMGAAFGSMPMFAAQATPEAQANPDAAAASEEARPTADQAVTFNKDIAPIVFEQCVSCHQPGGFGPFDMLTYASVRQHATQIALVTKNRVMPPWRAKSDYGTFIDQIPLSDTEIEIIQRWVADGALEGDPGDLPPPPPTTGGWNLGTPDLVVTLPEPFTLPRDGMSVFRNFVVPVPIDETKYVKGWEFHPGNHTVVHHSNIRIDYSNASRRLDAEDAAPGYDGIIPRSAIYPDGHLLAWTPGQVVPFLPEGLAWRLDPGTDFAIETHMYPSGKTETVQPSVGLYFTDDPPARAPAMIRLGRQNHDIPAGEKNYIVTDSWVLPVDVEVLAVQPHAHYRAKDVLTTATLPDGTTKKMIHIEDWDYNFQHLYRYTTPFELPKGTTIAMRYSYDNSADNPRNPDHPPRRVLWGPRSIDEMGHIGIQVFTKSERDYNTLATAIIPKVNAEDVLGYERVIELEPSSVPLHDDTAGLYLELGQPDKAVEHFGHSAALKPELPATHFNLGLALTMANRMDDAIVEYRRAVAIDPEYLLAHNNLAAILLQRGKVDEAMHHFREAVRINPLSAEARNNLGRMTRAQGDVKEAIEHFRQAVQVRPNWPAANGDLAWTLATVRDDALRNPGEAVQFAEHAVELTEHAEPGFLDILAAAYASAGDFDRAVTTADAALALAPPPVGASAIRARQELYKQRTPYLAP